MIISPSLYLPLHLSAPSLLSNSTATTHYSHCCFCHHLPPHLSPYSLLPRGAHAWTGRLAGFLRANNAMRSSAARIPAVTCYIPGLPREHLLGPGWLMRLVACIQSTPESHGPHIIPGPHLPLLCYAPHCLRTHYLLPHHLSTSLSLPTHHYTTGQTDASCSVWLTAHFHFDACTTCTLLRTHVTRRYTAATWRARCASLRATPAHCAHRAPHCSLHILLSWFAHRCRKRRALRAPCRSIPFCAHTHFACAPAVLNVPPAPTPPHPPPRLPHHLHTHPPPPLPTYGRTLSPTNTQHAARTTVACLCRRIVAYDERTTRL